MSIGQRISKLRKEKGYSQEYVAERLNVSRQAVSKWETDNSAPDTYNLIALAKLLDVSVEYIATGIKESENGVLGAETRGSKAGAKRTVGFILFGVGLLSLALGVLMSEILILLSVYLITGGVLCIFLKKRAWLVNMWTFLAATFLILTFASTHSLFAIFNKGAYQDGITIGLIVSYIFWIWLVTAVVITIIIKRRKRSENQL